MYTRESARRKIKAMGVDDFIKMVSSPDFSQEIVADLEKEGIFIDGYPSINAIYSLAQ